MRTACDIMEAIMESTLTSSSICSSSCWFCKALPVWFSPVKTDRSALRVPITSFPAFIGTQTKQRCSVLMRFLEPVRSRNSGSSSILGTTLFLPVLTTWPMIPSPGMYRPLACSSSVKPKDWLITISLVSRFRMVMTPRIISMCSDMILSTSLSSLLISSSLLRARLTSARRPMVFVCTVNGGFIFCMCPEG